MQWWKIRPIFLNQNLILCIMYPLLKISSSIFLKKDYYPIYYITMVKNGVKGISRGYPIQPPPQITANFRSCTGHQGPCPVEFWKPPRMEILQPLFIMKNFFLQNPVKIFFLLYLVALTACSFTIQTTRLQITCPQLRFLGKKSRKKKKNEQLCSFNNSKTTWLAEGWLSTGEKNACSEHVRYDTYTIWKTG